MRCWLRNQKPGQGVIQALGLLFLLCFVGGLAVDAGLYYFMHTGEQNAADSAALAAVTQLYKSNATSLSGKESDATTSAQTYSQDNEKNNVGTSDVEFGYVNPTTGDTSQFSSPDATNFPLTSGYNAVKVTVNAGQNQANSQIPSVFGQFLGVSGFNSRAQAIAIYGGGVSSISGVRPIYMCVGAWNEAIQEFSDPTIPQVTYGPSSVTETDGTNTYTVNSGDTNSCGNLPPGNWGFADFDGGGGGTPQVADELTNGYSGTVSVGSSYGPKPGNIMNSGPVRSALDGLVTNQTVITFPLYDTASGNGKNAQFHIVGFAGFVITSYDRKSSSITGYFKKVMCTQGCTMGSSVTPGGVTNVRLVQ